MHENISISALPRRLIKVKEWCLNYEKIHTCKGGRGIEPGSKFLVSCDGNGFIKTGNKYIKDADNIIILGDSFTENILCEEKYRFCSVAERRLRNKYGLSINILNGGMSGSNILHMIFKLLSIVIPLQPRLVLFVLTSIDWATASFPEQYWNNHINLSIFSKNELSVEDCSRIKAFSTKYAKNNYINMLRTIFDIAKIFNINFNMVLRCFLKKNDPRYLLVDLAKKCCNEHNIPCIDLSNILSHNSHKYLYDLLHLNKYGSIYFGIKLADLVAKLG